MSEQDPNFDDAVKTIEESENKDDNVFKANEYKIWMTGTHAGDKLRLTLTQFDVVLNASNGYLGTFELVSDIEFIDVKPENFSAHGIDSLSLSSADDYFLFKLGHRLEDIGTVYRLFADGSHQKLSKET